MSHCVSRSPSAGLVGGSVWDRLYLHLYSLAVTRRVCILLAPTRLPRRANGSSSSRRCLWQSAQACHGPRSCVYTRAPGHNGLALNQTNSNWGLFRFRKPCPESIPLRHHCPYPRDFVYTTTISNSDMPLVVIFR